MKEPSRVIIDLGGKITEIDCQPGETILEACLRQDLDAPYSCMAGTCTSCLAHLDSGEVEMEFHDALSDEEIAEGEILTCQARLKTVQAQIKFRNV